jgi:hypothetical protein
MKKINKVLLIAISTLFLSATQSYASDSVVNRYVQLKDGVAFAYVESPGFVGNSILLPEGVSWEDVKFKKYENGSWATAPVINTVTELVNNEVVQTQNTVFASDAKGDVVSPEVQTGWHKTNTGSYVDPITGSLASQVLPNSFERGTRVDTTTVLVNLEGLYNSESWGGSAVLSTIETNYENVTVIQSNGLKTTNTLETKEQMLFDSPKTIQQIEQSVENSGNSMIKKYLNIFFKLLHGWIIIT